MPGVLQADASASGSVRVEYDKERVDEAAFVAALGKLKVKPGKRTGSDHAGSHSGHDHGAGDHAGHDHGPDRTSVVWGKRVSGRVDIGRPRTIHTKKNYPTI